MKVPAIDPADRGLYAYHVLRVAVDVFGKPPAELSAEQLKAAHTQADKTRALEDLALSSPQGARITIPDTALDAGVAQIKARYPDEDTFYTAMQNSGLTERDLRRALWRELAFDAVMSLIGDGAEPVSDAEVEAYHADHPERFVKPQQRTARHMLITINPDYPDNTLEVAHRRIRQLYQQVCEDPSRFGELAMKHSECPSALDGGSLGAVPPGKLYESLDAVLFQLDAGEVGGPVQTEAGLHIIYCEAIEPGSMISLDQARAKIHAHLLAARRKTRQREWLHEMATRLEPGA